MLPYYLSTRARSLFFTTITCFNPTLSFLSSAASSSHFTNVALSFQPQQQNHNNKYNNKLHLPSSKGLYTSTKFKGFRGGALHLSEKVNGESRQSTTNDNNNDGDEKDTTSANKPPKGRTGWNHNLPSPDSDFWSAVSSQKAASSQETSAESNKEATGEDEPKTGWLHNREPASKKETKKKQQSDEKNKKGGGVNQARRLLQLEKMKQKLNHRIISPPTFHACGEGRRAVITEHLISVPLDHVHSTSKADEIDPTESLIDVYFSIVELVNTPEEESFFQSLQMIDSSSVSSGSNTKHARVRGQQNRATAYKEFIALKDANECCLYLQGGPGFGAPKPINDIGLSDKSSWVGAALGKGYKRIILMDQRGTGRSTFITKQTLQKKFPDLFALDDVSVAGGREIKGSSVSDIDEELKLCEKANEELGTKVREAISAATDYMTHFRADNIVKDAEAVKDSLFLPLEEDEEPGPRPWGAALGQSFGGFCMMTYLSLIAHPPKICLLTGGIAPMLTPVDDVYARLRERVKHRNLMYYDRYPGDVAVVKRIIKRLVEQPAKLPSGGILTARRFLQVGIALGGSPSAFASLHSLFSSAFVSEDDDDLTRSFLKGVDGTQPFDDHPIYFLMHESIYADGKKHSNPTSWSAHRAYEIWNKGQFDYNVSCESASDADPTLLFGEVIFPWMAEGDYAELSGLGMRALACHLASKDDWGDIYNAEHMRKVLADDGTGVSKAAAAVYYGDMYVDFDASMEVAQRGGPLEKCKIWVTNDYQHSGLRDDGATIFCKLLGMAKGTEGTPS